ncbi:MAG: Uma2 family endonuclease [Pyrinomonadaceae bacterium]|nr:Uma2 family endonuclease [Pyrinomonadaceae bacterium]
MSAVLEMEKTISAPLNQNESVFDEYRLKVEDYEKMIEYGIFDDDDKIELWEGKLVITSPKGSRHTNAIRRIDHTIEQQILDRAIISTQDPIRLDDYSEPEPDFALIEPPLTKYDSRHPRPEDIFLVMEVADTTVLRDREKAKSYARNGIRQYLILNLNTNEIEDYREPAEDGYRFKRTYTADESFNLVAFPDIEIKVSDLLPPTETNEE